MPVFVFHFHSIKTLSTENNFTWEQGPNSFQPTGPIIRLSKDLGILDEIVLADPSLPRYVYWAGELHALPHSLREAATSRLMTISGKIRAVLGLFGFISAPQSGYEESIWEFMCRHLGRSVKHIQNAQK